MKSKKKIAIISVYAPKGSLHGSGASGVGSYTKNLLTNMSLGTRKEIVVLADSPDKNSLEFYTEDDMIIDRCWSKGSMLSWIKQIKLTLKGYPNIETIHIQHEFNMFGGVSTIPMFLYLLFSLRKYNLVVTYHGVVDTSIIDKKYGKINSLPKYFPPLFLKFSFHFFYSVAKYRINTAIVHEKYFKKVLLRYGYKKEKISVIAHGIEDLKTTISKKDARKELGIPENKKVLLYFGFLAGYKGVDLLLDGFSLLDPEKYHLILAGGVPKRTLSDPIFKDWYNNINKRASHMQGVTRLGGFIEDELIPVLYSASDVLIIPYLYMLAASGPMALSLSYQVPFLVSDVFSPVIKESDMIFKRTPDKFKERIEMFFKDTNSVEGIINSMRAERLWYKISKQTVLLYKY